MLVPQICDSHQSDYSLIKTLIAVFWSIINISLQFSGIMKASCLDLFCDTSVTINISAQSNKQCAPHHITQKVYSESRSMSPQKKTPAANPAIQNDNLQVDFSKIHTVPAVHLRYDRLPKIKQDDPALWY